MLASAPILSLLAFSFTGIAYAQKYSATYSPSSLPKTSEKGQSGTNQCGNTFNQTGLCQNAYINSVTDFCLFAPPEPGPDSLVGNTERIEVAWCLKNGTGTRIIPDGAIKGVTFMETPDYVQVTGVGNLTLLNIPKGDAGGELDPHGADGNGNPIGGLVFSSAYGELVQFHEWTNFMAADQFCFRACKDGSKAPNLCQHIYDVMGCAWNMPGNYKEGEFQQCKGDTGEPMGIYGGSTFHQGDGATPAPHPAPSSSSCSKIQSVSNGGFQITGTAVTPPSVTASATGSGSTTQPTSQPSGSRSDSGSTPSNTSSPNAAGRQAGSLGSLVLTFFGLMIGGLTSMA